MYFVYDDRVGKVSLYGTTAGRGKDGNFQRLSGGDLISAFNYLLASDGVDILLNTGKVEFRSFPYNSYKTDANLRLLRLSQHAEVTESTSGIRNTCNLQATT